MLYRLCAAVLVLCLGLLSIPAHAGPLSLQALTAAPYMPDRVLVKFRPGVAAMARGQAHHAANGYLLSTLEAIDVQVIQIPDGTVRAALQVYASNPNVLYAEPDYYRVLRVPVEEPGPTLAGGANYFSEQWYLHNTGQDHTYVRTTLFGGELATTRGTDGADINAPEAWDITIGRATLDPNARDTPKVAVLDSGADCNALELQGKCLEQMNLVGLSVGYFDICSSDDPACDNLGHGTFVSSEVAANTDNGEGIAGAGWDVGVGIFKVCYNELVVDNFGNLLTVGLCPVSGSAAAIAAASSDRFDSNGQQVRSRYHVITMSYGSDWVDEAGNILPTGPSNAECDAIEAAWNQGVVIVAAAGNNGDSGRVYPAACTDAAGASTVMAVAASDHNDDRAGFSTYSVPVDPWVSLAAPGEAIIGVLPDAACGLVAGTDSCVDWWSGTSMAAPLVAGSAALVWTDLYADHPALATLEDCRLDSVPCNRIVRDRLQNNAATVGARGQDMLGWTRYGRLDVVAALNDQAPPPPPPPEPAPVIAAFSYTCTGYVCAFNAADSTGSGNLRYSWDFGVAGAGSTAQQVIFDYNSSGRYTVTLTVFDETDTGSTISATLNLKRSNRTVSGSVSAAGSDSGGNCPPKKQDRGQC
ncbi:PKD domain-containing protein [Marinobacterium halophilum]|uniref:PKD domain-containing protein n=1 Tax=Marinobacterium halophilum TaxID=267374 RepID=A0A2P8F4R3_9GAMM|nr:S8 family serine peptidase [Marinobacterium halophilum]PSL16703.1 PKD domain-containing protein [Marinobacterium halophilum]